MKQSDKLNNAQLIARHLQDVYFGGNWTAVNIKDKVSDLAWQDATKRIPPFHPIATLLFHLNYFVVATSQVLKGGPLDARDKFSFDAPVITNSKEWDDFLDQIWNDTRELVSLIDRLPETQLARPFVDEKYGSHYYCLQGLVEHAHYHLGQISMLRTLLTQA